eukprot:scaffold416_cov329-Pavlova_lutheri.AAC.43
MGWIWEPPYLIQRTIPSAPYTVPLRGFLPCHARSGTDARSGSQFRLGAGPGGTCARPLVGKRSHHEVGLRSHAWFLRPHARRVLPLFLLPVSRFTREQDGPCLAPRSSESVYLEEICFADPLFHEEMGHVLPLIALQLDHLSVLLVFHDATIAAELFLERFEHLLVIEAFLQPLHRGDGLAAVSLLHAYVHVFLVGRVFLLFSFDVFEWICTHVEAHAEVRAPNARQHACSVPSPLSFFLSSFAAPFLPIALRPRTEASDRREFFDRAHAKVRVRRPRGPRSRAKDVRVPR